MSLHQTVYVSIFRFYEILTLVSLIQVKLNMGLKHFFSQIWTFFQTCANLCHSIVKYHNIQSIVDNLNFIKRLIPNESSYLIQKHFRIYNDELQCDCVLLNTYSLKQWNNAEETWFIMYMPACIGFNLYRNLYAFKFAKSKMMNACGSVHKHISGRKQMFSLIEIKTGLTMMTISI